MVDYKQMCLSKGGRCIDWPRVVGTAYEKAQKKADDVGVTWLNEGHLGGLVRFTGVKYRGDIDVALQKSDQALAVAIVKEIHVQMSRAGFSRVGLADRPAKDSRGWLLRNADGKLLSHDLVYECSPVPGSWSTEVRCANIHDWSGLAATRNNQRESALRFWKTMVDAGMEAVFLLFGLISITVGGGGVVWEA